MARLVAIAVLVSVLLVINASAFRTTITTVEIDESREPRRTEGCREEVRRRDLSQCEQYLSQSRRPLLALRGIDNPQQQEQIQQCCDQIRRVDRQCQCEALNTVVEQQREQQQRPGERGQRQEEEQVIRRARDIQTQCRLPEECQVRSVWY